MCYAKSINFAYKLSFCSCVSLLRRFLIWLNSMGIVEIVVRRRRLSDSKDSSGIHAEIPMKNKFFMHDQAIISLEHRPFGGKNS